ncbi:GNAT family N-acetyltransferase [Sphingomonas sp. MMS24-J13]|uniref:GNAT family N-acetyltransferase n=1 Tax=Sphingomonas sp. MMS24-J13 TaxID=3238686 RepID=UPI00384E0E41
MTIDQSFTIRPLRETDHAGWRPLWDGYNSFYGRSGDTALPDEISETTWARFFDDAEPVHALVAEQQGTLIGLAHYLFHRSTTTIAPICYLQDLFTTHEARGKGVGGALIAAVAARAEAAGSPRLYWHTHETNAVARKLYDRVAERSGFLVYRQSLT